MQENNKEISPIKQRILQFIEKQGLSAYRVYKEVGMSKNTLSQKTGISEDNLVKFLNVYKEISPAWLVLGVGSMFIDKAESPPEKDKNTLGVHIQEVTPDYLLKRFEELVIENNELKKRLQEKKNKLYGLSKITPTIAAEHREAKLTTRKK